MRTGIGFLDHLVTALAFHARFDLTLEIDGDLAVDDHHTAEDAALILGRAFGIAWREAPGLRRFASVFAPLDEALARAVVDISGRPGAWIELGLRRESIGAVATENVTHFLQSFAVAAEITLHVDVLRGENDHHRAEAAFKATALALRDAIRREGEHVPSTKGAL
ncbi:MAG: imidazoleglycerol-phosphate dehydratase [Planctomycetota bacterium]